jgi:hypothetical protein
MLAKTTWLQPMMTFAIGEALGLLAAIDWVKELVFESVILCLDSKGVVESFNSGVCDDTKLGSIFARCRLELVYLIFVTTLWSSSLRGRLIWLLYPNPY